MKRIALLLFAGCIALSAPDAFALCEVDIQGPNTFGIVTWYDYILPGPACWDLAAGEPEMLDESCYGEAGFDYPYGVSRTAFTFVVGYTDIQNEWYADARLIFDDPNNNSFNQLKITATVTHNSVSTTTTLFLFNGGTGDLDCYDADELPFDAVAGDTVKITVEGRKWYTDTVIQVTIPKITNSSI